MIVYHSHASPALVRAPLKELRPTQLTVGYAEVERKARQWAVLGKKQRKLEIDRHVFPAVFGAGRVPYITDHHHLSLMWSALRGADATLEAEVQANWSTLDGDAFFAKMAAASYLWLYDANGVGDQPLASLPTSIYAMQDDPFRSLAWGVRDAGGYDDTTFPHADFVWANYLRGKVDRGLVESDFDAAIREGLEAAKLPEARSLPGAH